MLLLLASVTATSTLGGHTVTLSDGTRMPLIAAGTWQYNDSVAEASVVAAVSAGFHHIDTAADYQNQAGVSRGLKASGIAREDLFLTSKVPGCGVQGVDASNCEESTLQLVQEDQRLLSSSYPELGAIDLVLVHFPPCVQAPPGTDSPIKTPCHAKRNGCSDPDNCAAVAKQWAAMERAVAMGLVKSIGVSNYCKACLECIGALRPPVVNQVQTHVGMGADPQHFVSTAAAAGVTLQAWSPLGAGGHGSKQILSGNLTTSIGRAHGKSAAQVALKWIVQRGIAVVTKSSSLEHLKQDIDLFDFNLTAAELAALNAASFASADTPSFMCDDK